MRASLYGNGVTAVADMHDDGSLTLSILDASDRVICLGQWQSPEPALEPQQEDETASWRSQRRAS